MGHLCQARSFSCNGIWNGLNHFWLLTWDDQNAGICLSVRGLQPLGMLLFSQQGSQMFFNMVPQGPQGVKTKAAGSLKARLRNSPLVTSATFCQSKRVTGQAQPQGDRKQTPPPMALEALVAVSLCFHIVDQQQALRLGQLFSRISRPGAAQWPPRLLFSIKTHLGSWHSWSYCCGSDKRPGMMSSQKRKLFSSIAKEEKAKLATLCLLL